MFRDESSTSSTIFGRNLEMTLGVTLECVRVRGVICLEYGGRVQDLPV